MSGFPDNRLSAKPVNVSAMPKDRDWMDYANLISQVGQNVQLDQIKSEIARADRDRKWQELEREGRELDRELRKQELEDRKQELEDQAKETQLRLRDQIFQGVQRLKKIRAVALASNPRRALVVALISVHPPPTTDLEDYQDKERAQALQDDLAAFVHECEGRLDDAEQQAAKTCLDYLCGQAELMWLIGYARRKEHAADQHAKLDAELKEETAKFNAELENQSSGLQSPKQADGALINREDRRKSRVFLVGLGMAAAGIAVGVCLSYPADPSDHTAIVFTSIGCVLGIAFFIGIIWFADANSVNRGLLREKRDLEITARAGRIDQLRERLAARTERLTRIVAVQARIETSLPNSLRKKFGDNLSSADYRKIFEERAALIKEVLRIADNIPPDLDGVTVGGITIAGTLEVDEGKVQAAESDNASAETNEEDDTESEMGDDEELYQQAVDIIRTTRCASTSILQGQLRIGYNRAARIMELMEEKGIVGPEDGAQPREILVDLDKL